MHLLVVTRRVDALGEFARTLAREAGLDLRFTDGWANALAVARDMPPAFAVLDEGLENGPPLELARQLLTVNAMINVAVVSPLAGEEFHTASEGLGVLAPVPQNPTAEDARTLAAIFRRFL
jgi:ActR/RegA family two-component response regulator